MIFFNILQVIFILIGLIVIAVAFIALLFKNKTKKNIGFELIHYNPKYKDHLQECEKVLLENKEYKKKYKQKKIDKKTNRLFVLDFKGDIEASQTQSLKSHINALISLLEPQDDVLIRLESGGGTVVGYGLAAAHLVRLKNHARQMIISVDRLAASGGYMMAATAHQLIVAPFAIVGSIGVVTQIPNIYRLLKKNDVDFYEMTAGKHKRTLTLLGEPTEQGKEKVREQLQGIHTLFKNFLLEHRPHLDMDVVGTGEYWHGLEAQKLGLLDTIATSDEYLLQRMKDTEVYIFKGEELKPWWRKFLS